MKKDNRCNVYASPYVMKIKEEESGGRGFSERINKAVERYEMLIDLSKVDLTNDEKNVLSAILCGSNLREGNLRYHLRTMKECVEDSGLGANPGYESLLEKVSKASYAERMAMIEAIGL